METHILKYVRYTSGKLIFFAARENTTFSFLENMILQLPVQECVVPATVAQLPLIQTLPDLGTEVKIILREGIHEALHSGLVSVAALLAFKTQE